jgi:hypothetical protein
MSRIRLLLTEQQIEAILTAIQEWSKVKNNNLTSTKHAIYYDSILKSIRNQVNKQEVHYCPE